MKTQLDSDISFVISALKKVGVFLAKAVVIIIVLVSVAMAKSCRRELAESSATPSLEKAVNRNFDSARAVREHEAQAEREQFRKAIKLNQDIGQADTAKELQAELNRLERGDLLLSEEPQFKFAQ